MEKVLLIFSVASALCAVSTVLQRNYHFIYQAKNWTEARSYCRENFIDLATLADVNDVATLNKLANLNQMFASSNAYDAWIGLYNDINSWRWSMSDPSFYQQNENFRSWYLTQPDNFGGDEACAVINGYMGGWADVPCSQSSPSVCMDVSGMDSTFYPISISMNQTQAQSYCREHHTDLASVRNSMENQGLLKLIPPSGSWIGLYRNNWMWSDDSTFSFTYWNTPNAEPSGGKQSCVAANFRSSGLWEDWMCDVKKIFICYSGVAQRVVKLKLVRDSSLNLKDPVVLEDLLNQLKLKLKGPPQLDNVQLRWQEQPNGQVFSKDEEEKDASGTGRAH